jgi:hypothetical protein
LRRPELRGGAPRFSTLRALFDACSTSSAVSRSACSCRSAAARSCTCAASVTLAIVESFRRPTVGTTTASAPAFSPSFRLSAFFIRFCA